MWSEVRNSIILSNDAVAFDAHDCVRIYYYATPWLIEFASFCRLCALKSN